MQEVDIQDLLKKHLDGSISPAEKELLENWYLQWEAEPQLMTEQRMAEITARIYSRLPKGDHRVHLWKRFAVAAAVLLMVFGAGLFYFYSSKDNGGQELALGVHDIAPGKVGATLTLASGKKIRLANASKGELAQEAGLTISKSADGQVVYSGAESRANSENKINTLSTAKGQTYILTLSDKTQVWLNAASSITYAIGLNEQGQRRVKLQGEAYFQVAKDKRHPFIVEAAGQQVEVLGTHFNVSSYSDEVLTRTTLLEGSVRLNGSTVLRPGEQGASRGTGKVAVEKVNVEDVVAWKAGYFKFTDEDIQSVMRKIARWYAIDVVYEGKVSHELFSGRISRFKNISQVLKMIESTRSIHFKVEERRITVMP